MGINIKGVIKGSVFSLVITFFIIMILALLAFFTPVGDTVLVSCVYAAVIVGVLLGSIAVSKAAQQKVFLHAMLVALIYAVVLICISFLINGEIMFNSHLIFIAAGIFAAGFVGSVIGK